MPLSKNQKNQVVQLYQKKLGLAKNIIVLKQNNISVNDINTLRIQTEEQNSQLGVIKKKIFLKSLENTGYQSIELSILDGSIILLYLNEVENYAPLKTIEKYIKNNKKEQKLGSFEFIGGWFDKSRKDSDYVYTLATIPSKEELISKLLYLLKFPIQGMASVLDKIREKKEKETI